MFLLYLDASGTADLCDPSQRVYVLLGLSIHEGNWFALEERVQALKRRYALPGVPLELHAVELCCSISDQNKIADFEQLDHATRRAEVLALRRRTGKRLSSNDGILHLTRAERRALYEEALDLVGSHDGVRLFAEVIDKAFLLKATGQSEASANAFEQVVSRFDGMLKVFDDDHGILVADVDPNSELMHGLTLAYRSQRQSWGALEYVIETPFFVDSKMVSGIQLADMCAYAVRRYVEHGGAGSPEERNFLRVFHKFEQASGRIDGLRHFVARGCRCAICVARARAISR